MWDQRYGQEGFAYGTEPNDFLRQAIDLVPDGPVLCLAEGEGRNAVFVAEQGHPVTAVDLSPVGLRKAEELAKSRGVSIETMVADLAEFDLGSERWSGIVSIFAHLPAPVRTALHRRVVAALAPGGVMILEAYTPDQIGRGTGGPPSAEMMMSLGALRTEFAGLELEHALEAVRDVREGAYHTGQAAVVQVIARKPSSAAKD